ncbi:MAG: hypothetical protein Q9227_006852 [Pyrenula ochraceoflavens]
MVWPFSSSSSGTTDSKASTADYKPPDRNFREQCYLSRDAFYDCLDEHDILDASKHDEEVRKKCPKVLAAFERDCAKSWIKYFKDKRVMEYNRDQTIAKIKKDDAETAAAQKARKKTGGGWFG